ncbi:MAG: hypothetical protein EXR11_01565 [Rhodospirillaceae bacterium]|nr:hypothetical protein [Rhodospirillaceae bacterium]
MRARPPRVRCRQKVCARRFATVPPRPKCAVRARDRPKPRRRRFHRNWFQCLEQSWAAGFGFSAVRARSTTQPGLSRAKQRRGIRLLITRPAGDAQALAAAELRAHGHEVLACPLIAIEPTDEPKPNLTATQGFIVSDADGARALAEAVGVRTFPVFCDSAGTAAELARLGFTDARSADGDAAKLARFVERSLNPKLGGLVYVCSTSAPINLSAMLGNMGFAVRMAALYAVKRIDAMPDNVRSALESKALDGGIFFSADEARAFAHVVQRANLDHTTSRLLAVVASPVVAAPLTVLKFARVVTAPKSDALTLIGFVDDSLLPQPEPEKPAPVEEPIAPPPPPPVVEEIAPEPKPEPIPAPVQTPVLAVPDEPISQPPEPQPEIVTPPEPTTQAMVDEVRIARPGLFTALSALIGRLSAPKPAIQTVTPLEPESSAVPEAVAEPQVVVEAEPVASIAEEPPPTTRIEDQHAEEPVAAPAEPSTTAPEPISLATKIAALFRRSPTTHETLSDPAPEIQPSSIETPIENTPTLEPEPEPIIDVLPEP